MAKASRRFNSLVWACGVIAVSVLFPSVLPALHGEPGSAHDAAAAESSTGEPRTWKGPNGEVLPFKNNEEVSEFLRTAEVTGMEYISDDQTGPRRVLLEKDGIKMRAVFRDVNSSRLIGPGLKGEMRRNFRDYYAFEAAAYELAQMLGLDNLPPTVIRRIDRTTGSLQVWIENARTEENRLRAGLDPPNPLRYSRQVQIMHIFDNLIYNEDRNQGNILYDENWKLWMIDHTRAFSLEVELSEPEEIMFCDEELWENLTSLDESVLEERMEPFLKGSEIKALRGRRKALVEHIQKIIDQKGEKAGLFKHD